MAKRGFARLRAIGRPEFAMICLPAGQSDTGRDEIYIELDGKRIAKRGYPDTPQARTWVALEPGYQVLDGRYGSEIVVTYNGVALQ
jgi:hypothetical protein